MAGGGGVSLKLAIIALWQSWRHRRGEKAYINRLA